MGNMISPTVPVAISGPDGRPLFPADEVQWAGTPFTFVAGNSTAHGQALEDLRT